MIIIIIIIIQDIDVNVNSRILDIYISRIVPSICKVRDRP